MDSVFLYNIFTMLIKKAGVCVSETNKASVIREVEKLRQAHNNHGDVIVVVENYDWQQHGVKDIVETIRKVLKNNI